MEVNRFICISRDTVVRIDFTKIVYFEAEGNYTSVMTVNKFKPVIGMNLVGVEKELRWQLGCHMNSFVRVGKRYIINMDYVCCLNVLKQQLVLSDSDRFSHVLSISREALRKLKNEKFGDVTASES